ncbi:acyltransferase family protein [Klebsiella quasipneumoniae]|uniref:acyltransferase family protein n=1 Tax=Klebsiella quasipneumoniae TaxID=1463165 RepID=UPI001D107929|nr:acyltransferase [Klebsiella quasipneumoniae]
MAHDVPLGCAPDEYDDLISGTCSHLPQIRTFDVPMMVFVSGVSYFLSKKADVSYFSYAFSRFKRLVLPVWIFLFFFFLTIYLFRPVNFLDLLSVKNILSTYMLNGFGYVWVIRVFLIIAILSPLYVYLTKNSSSYSIAIIVLFLLLFSLLLSIFPYEKHGKLLSHVFDDVLFPAISYGAVFILGYNYFLFNTKQKIFVFSLFLLVFCLYLMLNYFMFGVVNGPQSYKYPPTLYYIAYSIVVMLVLYHAVNLFMLRRNVWPIILIISSNTIWIYLWHIPVVEYFYRYNNETNFFLKYLVVFFVSTSIALTQRFLVMHFFPKSKLMKVIFTG